MRGLLCQIKPGTHRLAKILCDDFDAAKKEFTGGPRGIVGSDDKQTQFEFLLLGKLAELVFCSHFNCFPGDILYNRENIKKPVSDYDFIFHGKRVDLKATRHETGRMSVETHLRYDATDIFALAIVGATHVRFPGYLPKHKIINQSMIGNLGRKPSYLAEQSQLIAWGNMDRDPWQHLRDDLGRVIAGEEITQW